MKIRGAALLAAAALTLSACGGGSDEAAESAPSTTAAAKDARSSKAASKTKAKPAKTTPSKSKKAKNLWSAEQLADMLKADLVRGDPKFKKTLVSCPKGLPAVEGASTKCTVIGGGDTLDVGVTIHKAGQTGAYAPTFTPGKHISGQSDIPPMIVATLLVGAMLNDGLPMDDIPDGDTVTCPTLDKRVDASGTCTAPGGKSWLVTVAAVNENPRKGEMPASVYYTPTGTNATPSPAGPDAPGECGSYENPCDPPEGYADPDADFPPECHKLTDRADYCPPLPEQ